MHQTHYSASHDPVVHYPASLSIRQDLRFDISYRTRGRRRAEDALVPLMLRNIARSGFMASSAAEIARGERLVVQLPCVGDLDAFAIWTEPGRAGFQFEKPLRPDLFVTLLAELGYRPLPLHGGARMARAS